MQTLEIVHRTRYEYSEPVTLEEYRLMFRPRDSHDLRLLHTGLEIEPKADVRWIHDPFNNSVGIASFFVEARALEFVSTIRLEHYGVPAALWPVEPYALRLPFSYTAEEAPDLSRCIERQYPDGGLVSAWAKQFLEGERGPDTFDVLVRMCRGIQQGFAYAMRFEAGTQPPVTTLEIRGGTCRDFALLMMEGARSLGLAARFVTGYLHDPVFLATSGAVSPAHPHAWVEVYLPGAGWVEFDPTNGAVGAEHLIRVAVGRDPEQTMPIRGTFRGRPGVVINSFVDVQVRPYEPVPR
ncbi:MAG: transglutaminase family protein [Proteobacteria bacterium]|nr:transglutaminase family protein [Pseudomonadota bacterium]